VLIDVVGPFALKEEERAEDESGGEEGEEGDADEAPEIEQTLVKQSAEAGRGVGQVAEEGSGYEEEVDEEVKGNGGVAEAGSGACDGVFMEVQVGFADGAEVEAAGETLSGQGVVEKGGDLEVERDREEEGEDEVEGVGPEERREASQSEGKAVEEDVAAFGHDATSVEEQGQGLQQIPPLRCGMTTNKAKAKATNMAKAKATYPLR
jgi:hypothetical protein